MLMFSFLFHNANVYFLLMLSCLFLFLSILSKTYILLFLYHANVSLLFYLFFSSPFPPLKTPSLRHIFPSLRLMFFFSLCLFIRLIYYILLITSSLSLSSLISYFLRHISSFPFTFSPQGLCLTFPYAPLSFLLLLHFSLSPFYIPFLLSSWFLSSPLSSFLRVPLSFLHTFFLSFMFLSIISSF